MKTPPPELFKSHNARRVALTVLLSVGVPSMGWAADWYLQLNQPTNKTWNSLDTWWSEPVTGGVNPTAINPADTFHTNGKTLNTPATAANESFAGKLVVDSDLYKLDGEGGASVNVQGKISIRSTSATATTTIPNLLASGGSFEGMVSPSSSGTRNVNIGNLTVTTAEAVALATGGTARTLNITVASAKGEGTINLQGGGIINLAFPSAPDFYGTLYLKAASRLAFQNNFVSKGGLIADDGTQITLNRDITVSSLLLGGTLNAETGERTGGTTYAPNTTYSYAVLQAAHPAIFTAGGSGSITVTQPHIVADAAAVVDIVGIGQMGGCIGTQFWREDQVNYGKEMKRARLGVGRTVVCPSKGFTIAETDMRVLQLLNAGVQPFFIQFCADQYPNFSNELRDLNGNIGTGGTPATNLAWLVKRYMAPPFNITNQYWEVHNEPDINVPVSLTYTQYIDFFQSIHDTLVAEGIRGNVKLCGPVVSFEYGFAAGTGGRTDEIVEKFLEAVKDPRGGFRQLDVFTRHVYPTLADSWETSPQTPNNAYNLLNAPCEQVTFTQSQVRNFAPRGEAAVQKVLRARGLADVGTGITEFNVGPNYRHTVTEGLWFLTYDHFCLYNPRHELSTGFQFDENRIQAENDYGFFQGSAYSQSYWATYMHGVLTGDEVLSQSSSDRHLLVSATRDESYVYLQVLNRGLQDTPASVVLNNADVTGSAAMFEFSATATPDAAVPTALGTSFSHTFPAMSSRVFRYLRTGAPTPEVPPAPPSTVLLDTDFSAAPAGMLPYFTSTFQPTVINGDLMLTKYANINNQATTVIFAGQPLQEAQKRVQVRFGFRVNPAFGGADGFVFGAYSADPGMPGGSGPALGYYGQPNQIWGVKMDNNPEEIGIVANASPIVNDMVKGGFVSQMLTEYNGMDLYMVIDYDGDAGTVRARLYNGTSDAGPLMADITNRLGNPAALPAGTVFGLTGSTNTAKQETLIHDLRILIDPPAGTLPAPWTSQDIGAVGAAGAAAYTSGVYTLEGSGADIAGTNDEFHYVHQPASGDCVITARVVSITNTHGKAKAGVMVRESLAPDAKFAQIVATPTQTWNEYRTTVGGEVITNGGGTSNPKPFWLRLTRVGNTFTLFKSPDGITWTQASTRTLAMAANVYIGLVQCSHVDGTLGTSVIDNVTVSP